MRSEQINELAAALAKAQGTMENAVWNRVGGFKNKYADFGAVVNAVRKPLSDNGISWTQLIHDGVLTTLMMHTSGQWLSSEMQLPVVNKAQDLGSVLTYYRRYQLSSICGVGAEDDDDDANVSTNLQQSSGQQRRSPPAPAQNVMRPYSGPIGASQHDPETGEVRQEEDDTSARASPAGPAAPPSPDQGAAGSLSIKAIGNIEMMAREAAARGREQFNIYFKGLPPEGKRVVTLMKDELEAILPPKAP